MDALGLTKKTRRNNIVILERVLMSNILNYKMKMLCDKLIGMKFSDK